MLLQHFHFREEHWERYRSVNARFADAAAEEAARAPDAPLVWVQDYHLALAPRLLRERMAERAPEAAARLFVHQFWHIPFPAPDLFNLLPTEIHAELLEGMLGNDLVEFHTERYATNFMDCVAAFVPGAEVRREHHLVRHGGREIRVGAFPISIDVDQYERLAGEAGDAAEELRQRYAGDGRCLAVSVDRIDYTKGMPERLRALDQTFEEAPELRGCLTALLVATPSRGELESYKELQQEVLDGVDAINARWGTDTWRPIVLEHRNVPASELAAIYRAADVCLVSSLQDGMNLVAKEFLACQLDERGVLLLSRLTGAAEEIEGAILINPFNVDAFASAIREALAMPPEERRQRMRAMRDALHRATIFDWLDAILARVAELAPPVGPGAAPRSAPDEPRAAASGESRAAAPHEPSAPPP
jgi:trehalose 6-phosphate synthase